MKRSNSYSLQKINPNLSSQRYYLFIFYYRNYSRISGNSHAHAHNRDRLSFPTVGDSGYYGGVGKKHY